MMKGIVFLGNSQCVVKEVPTPEPGNGEVRIQMKVSGICGSDLHVYRPAEPRDWIQGHESSGVVEKLGPNVTNLKVGDRVTVHHHQGVGSATTVHWEILCGARRIRWSVGHLVSMSWQMSGIVWYFPDQIDFIDGPFFACVGTTAYAALRRLGVEQYFPQTIAVYGLGPVGLSTVRIAKSMGARVIGVDVMEERIEVAKKCGADAAVNAATEDPVDAVVAFSGTEGVDYVVETSGSAGGRSSIIPSLRREGKAALVGVGSDDKVINPGRHGLSPNYPDGIRCISDCMAEGFCEVLRPDGTNV